MTTAARVEVLDSLNRTVADAAAYLCCVNESLTDGHQSARGVLAQMVYWHEQYAGIARALADGRTPDLVSGTYDVINMIGRQKFAGQSLPMLAHQLTVAHKAFVEALDCLPDWSINFPVKQDSGFCSIAERVRLIDAHIANRITLLKRAEAGLIKAKQPALDD